MLKTIQKHLQETIEHVDRLEDPNFIASQYVQKLYARFGDVKLSDIQKQLDAHKEV
jgi:hypothetical protein